MERIGEYEVERLVGEGGMGKVYEAAERLSGRRVALKVLRAELSRSESGRKLFLNEMRILASLEHPAIVRSLASFEEGDDLVLVLEFLDGTTLRQRLLERGRLPWADAVAIAVRVASALAAAHGEKTPIIHRDLKPDNIMLCGALRDDKSGALRPGAVKVMDFGIAKVVEQLTQTHTQSVGTLQYMSPEQIDARQIDARSDLYSLGLVLYEMLTGAPPFTSPSPRELLNLQCTAKPPALDAELRDTLPDGLEALVLRLLAKDPDDRPDTADEVVRRLGRILERVDPNLSLAEAPAASKQTEAAGTDSASGDAVASSGSAATTTPRPKDTTPVPVSSGRIDTRHVVDAPRSGTASGEASAGRGGVGQMLLVAGIAFALGALVLFLVDPLGGKRDDPKPGADPSTAPPPTTAPTSIGQNDVGGPFPGPDGLPTTGSGGGGASAPIVAVSDPSLAATHTTPDGAVAQLVRAGSFLLGSNAPAGEPDERPQRSFALGDYYIDTTEVTVASYRQCVDAGACSTAQLTQHAASATCNFGAPGREQHPMNCVSAAGAEAFCGWRSAQDPALRYRLPTEAEWEKAARGTDGRSFPWGEPLTTCSLALVGGCGATTTGNVATSPSDVSPSGVMDLGGRVSEWVLAVYDAALDERDLARPGVVTRNVRGGNWRSRNPVRAADRDAAPVPLDFGTEDIGFRCVGLQDPTP